MELLHLYKEQKKNAHFSDVCQMRYQEELKYIYLKSEYCSARKQHFFLYFHVKHHDIFALELNLVLEAFREFVRQKKQVFVYVSLPKKVPNMTDLSRVKISEGNTDFLVYFIFLIFLLLRSKTFTGCCVQLGSQQI